MAWRARLTASLNELRIVYCARGESSAGTREFVQQHYGELKKANPTLPIYIRPCDGVEPHVAARYDRGVYSVQQTSGMSSDSVLGAVEKLESQAGAANAKYGQGGLGIGALAGGTYSRRQVPSSTQSRMAGKRRQLTSEQATLPRSLTSPPPTALASKAPPRASRAAESVPVLHSSMTTRAPTHVGPVDTLHYQRTKADLEAYASLEYDRSLYSEEVAAAARVLLIAVRNRPQPALSEPDTASGGCTPPRDDSAQAPHPAARSVDRRGGRSGPGATGPGGHSRGTKRPAAPSRNGVSQKKKTKRAHPGSDAGTNGGSDTSNGNHSKPTAGTSSGSGGGSTSIPPNSEVACRVKEEGTATWILARVRRYVSEAKKYEVTDSGDDNSKTHMVFKKHIRVLPKKAHDIENGTRVLAVYPDTTTYYAAVVKYRRNGSYVLVFDDEDEEEADIEKDVNARHVFIP